jgi:ferrochelatase
VAWTGPDIIDVVEAAAREGVSDVLVQAVGFLVDHTEVTYDLDVEAGQRAMALGLRLTRAACVHDHPAFIATLADGVERALSGVG